jgi:hypothetical protein
MGRPKKNRKKAPEEKQKKNGAIYVTRAREAGQGRGRGRNASKKRKVPEVQTSPRNDSQQVLPDLNEEVQVEENTVQGRRQGCCEFECTSYNAPCIFQ